ncbi:MAG TPA: class I SAM-dependent methyltransferase [Mycobacteriales bacterium]|nr:class I SAM-dependent methyltransferase [Mycobacteriales bacterium]
MVQDDKVGKDKENFDHIYDQPDPRQYFRVLGDLDYGIPQHAQPVFAALLAARDDQQDDDGQAAHDGGSVLDVCCSYGVNAALLRCELTLDDIVAHYHEPSLAGLSPAELAESDRSFYAEHQRPNAPRTVGLDAAPNAVSYGCRAGLLDTGLVENLEIEEPSPRLAETLSDVGLITTTGGVGYITHRTFDRLLRVAPADRPPWVATFVLRMFAYDQIAETLERHGLVTEALSDVTFPQRRFASAHERRATVEVLRAAGLDPAREQEEGTYQAVFYLSRPAEDVAAEPLDELLNGLDFAA